MNFASCFEEAVRRIIFVVSVFGVIVDRKSYGRYDRTEYCACDFADGPAECASVVAARMQLLTYTTFFAGRSLLLGHRIGYLAALLTRTDEAVAGPG